LAQLNKVAASVDIAESDFTTCSAGGDFFENDARTRLKFKSDNAGALRVRVHESTACNFGHALAYVEESLPANSVVELDRTFPQNKFGGRPQITYPDGVSGLKAVAVREGAY
jgi:hypothetical protein